MERESDLMGGQVEYILRQWDTCRVKNPQIKIDDFLLLKQVPKQQWVEIKKYASK